MPCPTIPETLRFWRKRGFSKEPVVSDLDARGGFSARSRCRVAMLLTAALAVLAPLSPGWCDDSAPRREAPNILLIMADDQGWGDVGYNGHPVIRTPQLDEMAAVGLRFDRFYAAAPVCSPTRGSVLTGRHPNRFGCFKWGYTLRPQEVTVAEALRPAGYATGHFGKWHLGPVDAHSPVSPGNSGFDTWFSSPNFYDNDPLMSRNGKVVETNGESSMVTAEAAIDFIGDCVEREKPFLAVVWFGSPHSPHRATAELRKLYADQPARLQNYYGEVTGIDRAVGRLRRELRTLGIHQNTLVWYTSDNGGRSPGSTGGLSGQKGSLWEGGLRVPAIIEWPDRIQKPRRTAIPCGTVDIYPTLVDLLDVTVPEQPQPLDGISLVPLIDGRMESRSKPLGFWDYPIGGRPVRSRQILEKLRQRQAPGGTSEESANDSSGKIAKRYSPSDRPGHAAWIDGDDKLHRIPHKGGFEYRLFDLASDPQEKRNLIEEKPDRAKAMRAALEAWQRSVVGSLNGDDYR